MFRRGGGGLHGLKSEELGHEGLFGDCRHGQGAMGGGNPQAAVDVARDTNRAFAGFGFRDIFHSGDDISSHLHLSTMRIRFFMTTERRWGEVISKLNEDIRWFYDPNPKCAVSVSRPIGRRAITHVNNVLGGPERHGDQAGQVAAITASGAQAVASGLNRIPDRGGV